MNNDDKICGKCFWWDIGERVMGGDRGIDIPVTVHKGEKRSVRGGRCRRYAPKEYFSTTREDDWCGDFSALESSGVKQKRPMEDDVNFALSTVR